MAESIQQSVSALSTCQVASCWDVLSALVVLCTSGAGHEGISIQGPLPGLDKESSDRHARHQCSALPLLQC
jgi:hypothetical protein